MVSHDTCLGAFNRVPVLRKGLEDHEVPRTGIAYSPGHKHMPEPVGRDHLRHLSALHCFTVEAESITLPLTAGIHF